MELQVTHFPALSDWYWRITECGPSNPSQSPQASDELSGVWRFEGPLALVPSSVKVISERLWLQPTNISPLGKLLLGALVLVPQWVISSHRPTPGERELSRWVSCEYVKGPGTHVIRALWDTPIPVVSSPLSSRGTYIPRQITAAGIHPPPPQPPDCQTSTCTHTYKHTCVCTPRTPGEQAGTELVLDFIGGDSFSHFSVWITSSSWAMRGNEHCSTTKSRFRLTELVLGPVGFCCCCTAPPPDRTPTTAARDCVCVCVCLSMLYMCAYVCVTR